jgi:hypothetical protein
LVQNDQAIEGASRKESRVAVSVISESLKIDAHSLDTIFGKLELIVL